MHWHKLGGCLLLVLPFVCYANELVTEIAHTTPVIGTSEHPTLDGGLINPTSKDPLTTLSVKDENADPTHHTVDGALAVPKGIKNLPDEWGSDQNIKALLTAAAKDHKLGVVLQRAEQLKLPATVALIPMVESHYQTDAISPKGARGAWQLMPDTAKEYGLNNQTSQRFTPSTDAALQLLKHLHQKFGNWTLAFAAYNAGSGRVLAALQKHPNAQGIDDLDLPLETNAYLDRLKAIHRAMAWLSLPM